MTDGPEISFGGFTFGSAADPASDNESNVSASSGDLNDRDLNDRGLGQCYCRLDVPCNCGPCYVRTGVSPAAEVPKFNVGRRLMALLYACAPWCRRVRRSRVPSDAPPTP